MGIGNWFKRQRDKVMWGFARKHVGDIIAGGLAILMGYVALAAEVPPELASSWIADTKEILLLIVGGLIVGGVSGTNTAKQVKKVEKDLKEK